MRGVMPSLTSRLRSRVAVGLCPSGRRLATVTLCAGFVVASPMTFTTSQAAQNQGVPAQPAERPPDSLYKVTIDGVEEIQKILREAERPSAAR